MNNITFVRYNNKDCVVCNILNMEGINRYSTIVVFNNHKNE